MSEINIESQVVKRAIPTDREGRRQFWKKEVSAWESSGKSQPVYCRENGLVESQLYYWVTKLLKQPARPQQGKWVPMVAKEVSPSPWLRIRKANGTLIEVPLNLGSTELRTVLDILEC